MHTNSGKYTGAQYSGKPQPVRKSFTSTTEQNFEWRHFRTVFCRLWLTLLCCESIQYMLGSLWRSTPLLHATSRSPLRRRPGPQTIFSGLTCSVREMVSSLTGENSSPGNKISPTFSFKPENILKCLASLTCVVVSRRT